MKVHLDIVHRPRAEFEDKKSPTMFEILSGSAFVAAPASSEPAPVPATAPISKKRSRDEFDASEPVAVPPATAAVDDDCVLLDDE